MFIRSITDDRYVHSIKQTNFQSYNFESVLLVCEDTFTDQSSPSCGVILKRGLKEKTTRKTECPRVTYECVEMTEDRFHKMTKPY
jgi:hypothetical protein